MPLPTKWDIFYMGMVDYVATASKDRSTKIGAVLVKDNRLLGMGYNGMPSGVNDEVEARHTRPAKYLFFEHAERNVFYTAAKEGIATAGTTLYTTGIPCADCARAAIQSGVSTLVVWEDGDALERRPLDPTQNFADWKTSCRVGLEMLLEAGVEIRYVVRQ